MADISKLPGVTQTWQKKPLKTVHNKDTSTKKNNRNKNNNTRSDEDINESNKHLDEYI
ncbi:MAG: hypothetical protein ACC657_15480 [Thiohalomonadales bacterium]